MEINEEKPTTKECEICGAELGYFNWQLGFSFGEGREMCDKCYLEYC